MTKEACIAVGITMLFFIVIAVWPRKEPKEHPLVKEWKDRD